MTISEYTFACAEISLRFRRGDDARWVLFCNERAVCSYSSPESAARFVGRGDTGNSVIDRMTGRPQRIQEWQAK